MGILRIDVMSVVPVKQDMLSTAAYLEQLRRDANSPLAPHQSFATTMLLEFHMAQMKGMVQTYMLKQGLSR